MFYGRANEDAKEFLDSLELAYLIFGQDLEEVKVRSFPFLLKEKARVWYNTLSISTTQDWRTLQDAFQKRFCSRDTPEKIWMRLQQLRQRTLSEYDAYEASFVSLLAQLDIACEENQRMPDLLI